MVSPKGEKIAKATLEMRVTLYILVDNLYMTFNFLEYPRFF